MTELVVERNYIKDSFKEPVASGVYRTRPRSGKGSMGSDYFKPSLSGEYFFESIKAGDTPIHPGVYLVFYKYDPPSGWCNVDQIAQQGTGVWDGGMWQGLKISGMTIANYQNQRWGLNAKVLAYLGPLPTLALNPLLDCTPGFPVNQTFFISTVKMVAKGLVSSGPLTEYIHASLTTGFFGEYIFKMTNQDTYLTPIAKFDPDHKAAIKWRLLTEQEQIEILEKISELRE